MSMRAVSNSRTICEVLREINDMHQIVCEHDAIIRDKLVEAESMAKRMSYKLLEYNENVYRDFWETIEGQKYRNLLIKRLSASYLTGEK